MCNSYQMLFDDQKRILYKENSEVPQLHDGELLVRIRYTTLCGSDIHTFTGKRTEPSPIVLGHEIVGEIVALPADGPVYDLKGDLLQKGDFITWTIFAAPQHDEYYRQSIPQKAKGLFKYGHVQCTPENAYSGGLATHCILRGGTGILKVPAAVPPTLAPVINCAGATVMAAFRILDTVEQRNVVIFGAGVLGLIAAAVAKTSGAATVTMVDISNERLQLSRSFGADFVYNSSRPKEELSAITSGFYKQGFDVVLDMSGALEAMKTGLDYSAVGAQNIWVGGVTPMDPLPVNPELMIRRLLTIRGMHNYNYDDFVKAVDFFEQHVSDFPFVQFIEKAFPLEQAYEAFEYAVAHKPFRVLITNLDD